MLTGNRASRRGFYFVREGCCGGVFGNQPMSMLSLAHLLYCNLPFALVRFIVGPQHSINSALVAFAL